MGLFRRKAQTSLVTYDPGAQKPVIKCSICNGEQIAGFKNRSTGEFAEVMLIRNQVDLDSFKKMYNLDEVSKEY